MKDFGKKLISAAMALTLAASMSVYAEETSTVESVNDDSLLAIIAENAANGVGCANHVTFQTDEYLIYKEFVGYHAYNGQKCDLYEETYEYYLICMKCNATVKTIKRAAIAHTISHP